MLVAALETGPETGLATVLVATVLLTTATGGVGRSSLRIFSSTLVTILSYSSLSSKKSET